MFASVGRHLAILNALMVIAISATVGFGAAFVLRVELDRDESRLLHRRAGTAAIAWRDQLNQDPATVPAGASPRDHDETRQDEDDPDHDGDGSGALEGGDVVLYGVNSQGQVTINERGFTFPELPDQVGIASALAGETREQQIEVNGESVRLVTVPVKDASGLIVGAVQAARGQDEFLNQRSAALYANVIGTLLGVVLAPIAGFYLARRAMRPIRDTFATQRAFVADASHELRTPLAVLRANVELIQRMPDASMAEIQAEAGQLINEIDDMTRLVNDLLFLARADEQAPSLMAWETVDLASLLETERGLHQSRATDAGIHLDFRIDDQPALVHCDPDRLRQVLRILLDNALAYTPSGGSIHLSLTVTEHDLIVDVQDSGIGISKQGQDHVFDRFYREDRARTRQTGGAGLGLAIAKTIVEAHKGTISLVSELGHGTRVSLRLPRHDVTSTSGQLPT